MISALNERKVYAARGLNPFDPIFTLTKSLVGILILYAYIPICFDPITFLIALNGYRETGRKDQTISILFRCHENLRSMNWAKVGPKLLNWPLISEYGL